MDSQSEYLFKDTAKLNVFAPDKPKVGPTWFAITMALTASSMVQPFSALLLSTVDNSDNHVCIFAFGLCNACSQSNTGHTPCMQCMITVSRDTLS